jgi:hypothetical protein
MARPHSSTIHFITDREDKRDIYHGHARRPPRLHVLIVPVPTNGNFISQLCESNNLFRTNREAALVVCIKNVWEI